MIDKLGDRMKKYEHSFRFLLPPKSYTIIRLDARHFHEYTENMEKPFDKKIEYIMDMTTKILCSKIPNVQFGYTESDEINLLLTDFEQDQWYDGNIQKIISLSASIATAYANRLSDGLYLSNLDNSFDINYFLNKAVIEFDSRVFILPNEKETLNYFIWRNNDSIRNSISSISRMLYLHEELLNVNTSTRKEMISNKGTDWETYPNRNKYGSIYLNLNKYYSNKIKNFINNENSFDFYKEKKLIASLIPTQKNN